MERRRLNLTIFTALFLLLSFTSAYGIDERNEVAIAQLKYQGGDFEPYTSTIKRLCALMVTRTSIPLAKDKIDITINDKELFNYPFLYMAGAFDFEPFSDDEIKILRKYLNFGGTLFIDDTSGFSDSGFDRSVQKMIKRIFPDKEFEKLGEEHTVFRSFYLLDRIPGRKLISPYLFGINIGDITPVIYCKNDIGGALAGDDYGGWENNCTPGGERQREMSFRLGINIVMYSLCANYKKDQIHIPFILQRRK